MGWCAGPELARETLASSPFIVSLVVSFWSFALTLRWTGTDKGYNGRWVDNNGDSVLDWCRLVGSPTCPVERCVINTNGKLGQEEQGR